jgi:hypothetical protein
MEIDRCHGAADAGFLGADAVFLGDTVKGTFVIFLQFE